MKHPVSIRVSLLFILIYCSAFCSTNEKKQYLWTKTRGINISATTLESDFRDLSDWGVDHIRLTFAVEPFINLQPPYDFNEESFVKLGKMLDICEKHKIRVVIDPHSYPGCSNQWTMLGSDKFWTDFKWHQRIISLWEKIAQQCAERGMVVAGYALLNEPAIPYNHSKNSPSDLNLLYNKLVIAIRKIDKKHTIIVSAPRLGTDGGDDLDYIEGLAFLDPLKDNNLCYEIHMYQPMGFTHQGVWEYSELVKYPGIVDNEEWNIEKIREYLKPAFNFAEKNKVKIYVGEFSCPRWLGNMGNQYLNDLISVFEKYSFSWAYHAFRENQLWDAEMNNFDKNNHSKEQTTPRKELLINSFNSK